MKDLKNIMEYLGDIIATRDIIDGARLELLDIQGAALYGSRDIFEKWRDADKATADAVQAIHALAVAVERQAKNEKGEE